MEGSWLTISLLMLLGFILLLVEVFVIPGFGVTGITGLAALAFACYLAFTRFPTLWPGTTALLGTLAVLIVFIKFFPRTKSWKRLRLNAREESKEGFAASSSQLEELVGKTGISLTMLRPAGTAEIGEKRVDVVSEGIFVPKDTKIKVVMVKGNRVVVRKI
jgi:membrane-bound serine protease (ClpP class)